MGKLLRDAERTGTLRAKLDQMRTACIPVPDDTSQFLDGLDPTQVQLFLEKRAHLLVEKVALVLGDSLDRSSEAGLAPGDDEDIGDA